MALITIQPTKRQLQLEALRALARKIRLETRLKFELGKFFRSINSRVSVNIRAGNAPPDMIDFSKRLERILIKNVKRIADEFKDPVATIREDGNTAVKLFLKILEMKQTPDTIADQNIPSGIKTDINDEIRAFLDRLVGNTVQEVINTTQKDITTAISDANNLEQERISTLDETAEPNKSKIARLALAFLAKKALSRISTIAATVTQQSAEDSKQVAREAVIAHEDIDTTENNKKVWVTVGDNLVRATHVAVDGQERGINEPFNLEGGNLMFPTDTSLGASPSEIINCRCSAPPSFFNPTALTE